MSNLVNQEIKGYQMQEVLGEGGFGAVYRAFQPLVKREVAIKVILPEFANQPDFVRRFEAEAQLVARLEHLHIVPLYDYWRDPSGAFLVMRMLRGLGSPWTTQALRPASRAHAARQRATPSGGMAERLIRVPVATRRRSVDDRQPGRCGQPSVS